ncbi:tetratricopeptide (TPR) repeat protein [Paraburkholderia sp. GAS199]|uniref:tetratricopeptide repeat protein n=1 Tax=Paraburkholderia sp. GAS199 TaxID=3035126 RepID=UPI003D190FA7
MNHGDADPDALIRTADALFASRRMREALCCYRAALAGQPRHAQVQAQMHAHALHRMALVCVHTGETALARGYLRRALQVEPECAQRWEHAGLLAAADNQLAEAEALYRRAFTLAGGSASLHRNMADCLRLAGRFDEARAHYRHALDFDPGLHHALRALARLCTQQGLVDDAADYWQRAWASDDTALQDGLDAVAALATAKRTHALATLVAQLSARFARDAEALKSLAYVLNTHDCFSAALSVAQQGLALAPDHALLHHNAARALSICGKTAESLPHSLAAARLQPDNARLQFQLAGVLLALGEFDAGWRQYRWFYALAGSNRPPDQLACAQWQGEPLAGRVFLLVGEQGLGDEIQCIRFASWLHRRGAIVDVLVSEPVAHVAASMPPIRHVFTTPPSGFYDFWSPMLRMPEHMKLDLAMLPAVEMPYLAATPHNKASWRNRILACETNGPHAERYAGTPRLRVGLVWAGNPAHPLDRFRSIDLTTLTPLLGVSGITWYALQKGAHESDSVGLDNEYDLHALGPAIENFDDTLAILATLDLLITADTSAAHLAGAAGRPVWVLVPAYTEWRWLAGRADSPWYPSMRLFRAREPGVWDDAVDALKHALLEWRGKFHDDQHDDMRDDLHKAAHGNPPRSA